MNYEATLLLKAKIVFPLLSSLRLMFHSTLSDKRSRPLSLSIALSLFYRELAAGFVLRGVNCNTVLRDGPAACRTHAAVYCNRSYCSFFSPQRRVNSVCFPLFSPLPLLSLLCRVCAGQWTAGTLSLTKLFTNLYSDTACRCGRSMAGGNACLGPGR